MPSTSAYSEADVKLMLAMIASAENMKTDNDKLATLIGGGVTANAMRQRVQKIKTLAREIVNSGNLISSSGDGASVGGAKAVTPAKTTPAKRKTTAGSDADETNTPSKKRAPAKRNSIPAKPRAVKGAMTEDDENAIEEQEDHNVKVEAEADNIDA